MNNDIRELIETLKRVNQLLNKENLKKATTEELLEYNEQINKIKAIIIEEIL